MLSWMLPPSEFSIGTTALSALHCTPKHTVGDVLGSSSVPAQQADSFTHVALHCQSGSGVAFH